HRLHPDTLNQLHDRTQGWAAGVVLMLEQSQSGATLDTSKLPTDQKLLFDYFAGEILNRSDPLVREFLLKTALFPKFGAAAARALTGIAQTQDILDDLTRRNYFTVRHTGPAGDTYQYHPLFREFLLKEGEKCYPVEDHQLLRRQAARLLETQPDIEGAVPLYQQAGEWGDAARLILAHAATLLGQGRNQQLLQWVAATPMTLKDRSPWLLYWEGMGRLAFDPSGARPVLERAYTSFKNDRDVTGAYAAWAAIVDSFVFEWTSFTPMLRWIEEFNDLSRVLPVPPVSKIEEQTSCAVFLALMYALPQHHELPYRAESAERVVQNTQDMHLRSKVMPHLLIYRTWWQGDLPRAETALNIFRPYVEREGITPLVLITWHTMCAAYYWMSAATADCVAAVDQGLARANETGVHIY
ncbi:MAG: hypothetical protein AAB329_05555, partial [Pseudomonadota bacterium]